MLKKSLTPTLSILNGEGAQPFENKGRERTARKCSPSYIK